MAQLLRQLTPSRAWLKFKTAGEWAADDCPSRILCTLANPEGVSVWKIEDENQVLRTIAAISMTQSALSDDVVYTLTDEDSIKKLGIRTRINEGKSVDRETNGRHLDLVEMSGRQVIHLARHLMHECEHRAVTKADILQCAVDCFARRLFERELFVNMQGQLGSGKNFQLVRTFIVQRVLDFQRAMGEARLTTSHG